LALHAVLLATLAWVSPVRAQVYQFAQAEYSTTEAAGGVDVVVTVSGIPEFYIGVLYETVGGTAIEGDDYTAEDGFLAWPTGDTSPKTIHVPILADDLTEDPETFTVELVIADGGVIGEPSVTTVTILDGGDGELRAFLDVGDAIPTGGDEIHLFGTQGTDIEVRVYLNQVPPAPVLVPWTSDYPPYEGLLSFVGTTERSFTVTPPDAGIPLSSGKVAVGDPLSGRVATGPRRGPVAGWVEAFLDAVAGSLLDEDECSYCFLDCLLCEFGLGLCECSEVCDSMWGQPTPARGARAFGGDGTGREVLQRYRDEMLATTPQGQYYTALYRDLSGAIGLALVSEPTFVYRVLAAKDEWVSAISALVDGQGSTVVITPSMASNLNALLDEFEQHGSPELASAVQLERTRLHLDTIEGLSLEQFQQQVETFGGTPTRHTSWGGLKERYR